jgi:hypothetical protein
MSSSLAVSCCIGQSATNDAAKCILAALSVLNAEGGAVVVTELKLRDVAVQMLLGAMLIDALHAALENRKAAFDSVRVNAATAILTGTMIHSTVAKVHMPKLATILRGLVRHNVRFPVNVPQDDRDQRLASYIVHHERTALAALAMDKR